MASVQMKNIDVRTIGSQPVSKEMRQILEARVSRLLDWKVGANLVVIVHHYTDTPAGLQLEVEIQYDERQERFTEWEWIERVIKFNRLVLR